MKRFNIFKKRVILPVVALAISFSSCSEIIELEPYTAVSETVAFTTPSLIELSMNGMYNAAQEGTYSSSRTRGYPFGAATFQQNDCRGEDVVNAYGFYKYTYTNTVTTSTDNNEWYWVSLYRLINRCNIIIEGVTTAAENGVIESELALEYEGEAKLLRAMSYQELLYEFCYPYLDNPTAAMGGVPIHTEAYTGGDDLEYVLTVGRSTVQEVYDLILEDYDFAESNLPAKGGFDVRATKEAAIALKARTYLHMYDFDKVISEVEKSEMSAFTLTDSPSGPWSNNYSNTESIFSLENSSTSNPGSSNAALACQYKRRLLVNVSPIVWGNSYWLADDLRRKGSDSEDEVDDDMIYNNGGALFTNKYRDVVNYADASPIIRYAEVLLIAAEAYTRKALDGGSDADLAKGLEYLNQVRDRSLADPTTQTYSSSSFSDGVEQLEAIIAERRIEFVCEGKRWPDIHRLQFCPYLGQNGSGEYSGIPAKYPNTTPSSTDFVIGTEYSSSEMIEAKEYSSKYFLWPIPLEETNANPLLLEQQNPGW